MIRNAPASYAVRVEGHLDDLRAAWLGEWTLHREPDATTLLTADAVDQAQLHGLLAGLRDLGAVLVSVSASSPAPPALPRRLHTARLTLRPAAPEDAECTWAYRGLDAAGEWLTETPTDLDDHRRRFLVPDHLASTVIVEHGGRVVGDAMLRLGEAWAAEAVVLGGGRQAELGGMIDPAYSGQGLATEAAMALLEECFANLGVRRVVASCFLADSASWRLLERLGMRREQHAVRGSLHRSGSWLDTVTYAILRDEWADGVDA